MEEDNISEFEGDNRPVEMVSWWETLEFCNKLSEKYGLEPVYDLSKSEEGILRIRELGGKIVNPDIANFKNTEGFRLPIEVEWEWFSKGGQVAIGQGTFNYEYSGSNNINEVAWYYENSNQKNGNGTTRDVGLKKANQLGLYDCSGNVWEWCYDTTENVENGKSYVYKDNIYRRLRGGSWYDDGKVCTVFFRSYYQVTYADIIIGFRFVRTI